MPSAARSQEIDSDKADKKLITYLINSNALKWFLGTVAAALLTLTALGWTGYLKGVVSETQDVKDSKATLAVMSPVVAEHTLALKQASEFQGKLLEAIRGISKDVHELDVHVGKLDQRFDDLSSKK